MKITLTAALTTVSLCLVYAQLKPGDSPRSFQIPTPEAKQGHYLAALGKLEAAKSELEKDEIEKNVYPYVHSLLLANMGLQEKALAEAFGPRLPDSDFASTSVPELDRATRVDAIRAIAAEAAKTQIVVLNEWHHVPQHRAFALLVARALWKKGYRYLAAEALTEKDPLLQPNGYVHAGVGYTAEPMFADFLRQAKRIGFKLIRYEVPTSELVKQKPEERNDFRDSGAARNIRDRVFGIDRKAKVMVYCGGDHVVEATLTAGDRAHKRLAGYLKEITGIDPLTVDQITEQSYTDKENQIPFRYAQRRGWVSEPTVFRVGEGKYWTGGIFANRVDMVVFHPAPRKVEGREAWTSMNGYRKPFRLDPKLRPTAGKWLATAMVEGETADAVPMDMVVVEPTGETPALFLPRGRYVLRVQDETGKIVLERKIRRG